ncbi:MAG: amidohydrolase family protein [Rhizobacter sp.]|nr:amidohydrolase family protein [Ferruginibacter sp.]
MRRLKTAFLLLLFGLQLSVAVSQETYPVNGVADKRTGMYAFTNATIFKDAQNSIAAGTLLIKEGRFVAVGTDVTIPKDATVVDCKGRYIYPSFIDIYSDYGITTPQRSTTGFNFNAPSQLTSNTKGAYGWNQAIRSEVDAVDIFAADASKAKSLRESGFGVVLTHQKDGIARGTGAVVTLADKADNLVIIKEKASSHYSFSRGTSTQNYPSSLMGSIALLRQTFLDGQWYKNLPAGQAGKPATEGTNLSLQAWNNNLAYPLIFEANDKWNDLRADRVGDEFGVQFIMKAGGNEYQRIKEIAATKAPYILPLNFPQAMDVEDPNDARFVSLGTMKHWEMAPGNPAAFEKAGITFCITTADLRDAKQFLSSLRKAIEAGLSETKALEALTKTPATLLNVYSETGSIDAGKWANFIITSGPVFAEKTSIIQNWVQGEKYTVKEDGMQEVKGNYALTLRTNTGIKTFSLDVKSSNSADVLLKDTVAAKFSHDGKMIKLSFNESKRGKKGYRLSGVSNVDGWSGNGTDSSGNNIWWTAAYTKDIAAKTDSSKKKTPYSTGILTFPNGNYGVQELLKTETLLIKNATVWTNEKEGILNNTDVLVVNGKISAIGKNLTNAGARIIDGTGKYLTPGIIDEHSHIAVASINEGGQSVTSEVRIADNLDPEDVDIYRQLSGGVTTSHILHGSANTIGGQTQLIKLRWGVNDEELKFKGADGFIKFALGENVKRTTSQNNNRFPDTRMGVEQVQMDAFTRAKDYENALKGPNAKNVRRDLELDALVEIMNKKRFITCHSYVQSEILETMKIAEQFDFTINTFTHILEGYKVADKMKAHGAAASTFSDWWAYKMEVQDAIPYNAGIMNKVGLNVAINSDDGEMARRLNQEAAKTVKYSGISEEEAFKMVTLNPAKMLHIDNKVGSIKTGKDADLVLWSGHPLSIYAKAEKTMVDGIVYFDREKDAGMRKEIATERNRLVLKMLEEKKGGGATVPATPSFRNVNTCMDHSHNHALLDVHADEIGN